jgi:hypothetical protein
MNNETKLSLTDYDFQIVIPITSTNINYYQDLTTVLLPHVL